MERQHVVGIGALGGEVVVEASVTRQTSPSAAEGLFGAGLAFFGLPTDVSTLAIAASRVDDSARAGALSTGATLSVADTRLTCAAIDLVGAASPLSATTFDDRGGNACGCPTADRDCKLVADDLTPPIAPPMP